MRVQTAKEKLVLIYRSQHKAPEIYNEYSKRAQISGRKEREQGMISSTQESNMFQMEVEKNMGVSSPRGRKVLLKRDNTSQSGWNKSHHARMQQNSSEQPTTPAREAETKATMSGCSKIAQSSRQHQPERLRQKPTCQDAAR